VPASSRGYSQKYRPKYYRYDPDQARNARPLLSQESIKGFFKHRNTHWGAIFLTSGGIWFYVSNLEEVPVSHRRRFNIYRPEDVEGEGARMYQQIMQQYGGAILPAWDRRTKMVHRVMARLIRANGLENVDWEVHVIASDGEKYVENRHNPLTSRSAKVVVNDLEQNQAFAVLPDASIR
jgi:hypothetical protein